MYNFIKEYREGYLIREEDIEKIENCFEIKIPLLLKEFYCKCNGAKIHLCQFCIDDFEHEIAAIFPLKYGKSCVEKIIENDRSDRIIPSNMIPIANNEGGDYYYWDTSSENVYLYYHEDIENPIYICKNIEELFRIMVSSII